MRRALIGHTGFVGSNLDRPGRFVARYNSKNIDEIRGVKFDEVWCAGVQAKKWWANLNPETDWAHIASLLQILSEINTRRFVLISTIDVYRNPCGVDEDSPTTELNHHPYGVNRLKVERFVAERFEDCQILRLPGLYGKGLKKNFIYDVVNGRLGGEIHPSSTFQFYGLDHLWADAHRAAEAGIGLINVAVGPVTVASVYRAIAGAEYALGRGAPLVSYDMRTKHSSLWGSTTGYLYSADECLRGISAYAGQVKSGCNLRSQISPGPKEQTIL